MSAKARADLTWNDLLGEHYILAQPNRPSSGIMENLHWMCLHMGNFEALIQNYARHVIRDFSNPLQLLWIGE